MKPYSTGGQRSSTGAYACRDSSAKSPPPPLSCLYGLYLLTYSTACTFDPHLSVPRELGGSEVAFTYM